MASCTSRLHQIQRDVGLSDKELKQAVRDVTRPREVKLPTYHEKISKQEKARREYEIGGKRRKRAIAYWYLHEYLTKREASRVYLEHQVYKELIEYAYQQVMALVQLSTYVLEEIDDPLTMFPEKPLDEYDIPDSQWKEFGEYCKTHPLKRPRDLFVRRHKFKKWRYKKRGKYYSKKRMRMYDPLFAMETVNGKDMIKNLRRIGKENELRTRKFHELLNDLVADKSIGSTAMARFNEQTEEIMKRHKSRIKQFMKERKMKPTPISFSMDNDPTVFYDG